MAGYDPISPTTKGILRKLGGDKDTSVIFPKTELELVPKPFAEGFYFTQYEENVPFVLIIGQQYKVVWNGVEYNLTCFAYDDGESTGAFVGNAGGSWGTDNTGEPFIISYSQNLEGVKFIKIVTTDATATVSISAETIVPIDPKYLPNSEVDLDELGLTNPILLKFNEGGGFLDIKPDNNYGIDTEKVCKAFPLDKGYNVKLTIPGMGIMAINPVYTLFTDGKFRTVHLDSYVYIGDVLKKFYVRINGSYPDSGFYSVHFKVGFYE